MNQAFVKIADGDLYPITPGDFENTEVDCAAGVSSEPVFPLRSLGSIEFTVTPPARSVRKLMRVARGWNARGPMRGRQLDRAHHMLLQASIPRMIESLGRFGFTIAQVRQYAAAARFSLERQATVKGRRS